MFLTFANSIKLYKNVHFHATNVNEVINVEKKIKQHKQIFLVANLPKKVKSAAVNNCQKEIGHLNLISVARISPEKNTLYAIQVLAGLKTKGTVQFSLYGTVYNHDYWAACNEIIKRLPNNIKVNFLGALMPDEVTYALAKHHFMFMPTQGENFGHIILESLSAGTPVIISDKTPWLNLLDSGIGFDMPLNNQQAFQDLLAYWVMASQKEYGSFRNKCIQYAASHLNCEKTIANTIEMFNVNY
ncbi:MAG: glycosyltransferase [Bacteroidales bacterium]|nr:glycosyltransferase [Bacteroidales bacterium]